MESPRPGFKAAWVACGVTMILFNLLIRMDQNGFHVEKVMLGLFFGIFMTAGLRKQSRFQLRVAAWIVLPLLVWAIYLMRDDPWWLLGLKIASSLAMLAAIRWMYGFLPERLPKETGEMNAIDPEYPDPWEK